MLITRFNYEIYAVDYLDKTLSQELKKEFETFLEQNPEIKEEIMSMMWLELPTPDNEIGFDKSKLYRRTSIISWKSLSIAASLLLLVCILLFLNNKFEAENNMVIDDPVIESEEHSIIPQENADEEISNIANGKKTISTTPKQVAKVNSSQTGNEVDAIVKSIPHPKKDIPMQEIDKKSVGVIIGETVESIASNTPVIQNDQRIVYQIFKIETISIFPESLRVRNIDLMHEVYDGFVVNEAKDKKRFLSNFLPDFIASVDRNELRKAILPRYITDNEVNK